MTAGTVAIRFDHTDSSDAEIRQLTRWLQDEDDLRGKVNLASEPIQPGQMGGAVGAVVVVVTSGTAGVLVRSLFDWLARRTESRKVAITVESDSGKKKIDLSCGGPADADRLLEACRRVLEDR